MPPVNRSRRQRSDRRGSSFRRRLELNRIRQSALDGIENAGGSAEGMEIENVQLLRRQVARHCVYGVDINGTAVQLARLALWIHAFVPGLLPSSLDFNIRQGNSLVGIATFGELTDLIEHVGDCRSRTVAPSFSSVAAEEAVWRLARLS